MSLPSLDTTCFNIGSQRALSGMLRSTDPMQAVVQVARRKGADTEMFDLSATEVTQANWTTFYSIFNTARYSSPVTWTPPKESSARAFRFKSGSLAMTAVAPFIFSFQFSLVAMPNVNPA